MLEKPQKQSIDLLKIILEKKILTACFQRELFKYLCLWQDFDFVKIETWDKFLQWTGVSNLCRALPSSKLVELDLRDCRISSEGAQFLADVLPQCKSLKVIKLDENNLGEGGGMALGNAIQNSQVEDLNVNSSSICDEGKAI